MIYMYVVGAYNSRFFLVLEFAFYPVVFFVSVREPILFFVCAPLCRDKTMWNSVCFSVAFPFATSTRANFRSTRMLFLSRIIYYNLMFYIMLFAYNFSSFLVSLGAFGLSTGPGSGARLFSLFNYRVGTWARPMVDTIRGGWRAGDLDDTGHFSVVPPLGGCVGGATILCRLGGCFTIGLALWGGVWVSTWGFTCFVNWGIAILKYSGWVFATFFGFSGDERASNGCPFVGNFLASFTTTIFCA